MAMIDQQLIDMMDDPNPQVRSQAVKQLAKTKSQEAVQYLAAIYKTDDDPEIRELARKAGLYIKKKMVEENWTGGDPGIEDDPIADEPEEIPVSPRAVESSKGYMDTAMNLHVAGDDNKALGFVEKAFTTNPNLRNDSYYVGLASTIMGVPGPQAIDILLGDFEYDSKSGKAKRKRKTREGDISTEKVLIDLVIYFIVIFGLVMVGMLLLITLFNSAIEVALVESPEFAAMMNGDFGDPSQQMFVDMINGFVQGGFVISLVTSLFAAVYSVIVLVLQLGCMHVVASMMLGGDGTFKQLIHKMVGVLTFYSVAYVVLAMLLVYLLFNGVVTENISNLSAANMVQGIMGIGSLVYLIWFVMALGKVYKFGAGSGCITIILGSIVFGIVIGIISFGLSAALTPLFFGMMGGVPAGF